MKGTFFVHADDSGFQIGPGIPTDIPVSAIRAIDYTGPRVLDARLVADLNKWFEDRIQEGFAFEVRDSSDGN